MAQFGLIKNKVNCSIAVLGTGTNSCTFDIKRLDGFMAVRRGTTIPDATEFDTAFWQGLIQQGTAIPVLNSFSFADNSTEDTIQTSQSGVKVKVNGGRYEFTFEYIKGTEFARALSSLDTFGFYDIVLIDDAKSFLMTENAAGVAKGFRCGMLNPEKLNWNDGTDETSKSITMQLLTRSEVDDNLVYVTEAESQIDTDTVDGINDITATYVADPIATDTTLTVDFISIDRSTKLSGLEDADIRVLVNGVVDLTTWVESTVVDGEYVGTLAGAALVSTDVVTVQLYDTTATAAVIYKGIFPYQSNALTFTVA